MHVGHTETAVVTGKPLEMGGSLGRREATGRGVMIVARESALHVGFAIKGATVAIQGFGNVGSVSATLLAEAGAKIVAVTDWKGAFTTQGLDIGFARLNGRKTVEGRRRAADQRPAFALTYYSYPGCAGTRSRSRMRRRSAPKSSRRRNGPTTPKRTTLHARGVSACRHPG
jgi:glutamate dehydrogenase (NAD(P)+)